MDRTERKVGLVLSLTGCLVAACTAGSKALPDNRTSATAASRAPFKVHVFNAQPSAGAATGDRLIPASLSVEDNAVILAERAGRIISLSGIEGARIRKGQVLARFDDQDQRANLRETEIELSRVQVEEQQYASLVKLRRSELDREQTLAKEGVSSYVNVEQAQYKLEQANHEYEKSKLASASGLVKIKAAQIEIEKSTVSASITGVIIHRYATLGSTVAQNDKLFEVSKLAPLELKFQVPQDEDTKLHAGEIINLSAANDDRIIARARIRRIDPVADSTSNTFGYLADVVSGSALMPGLAVNIHLPRPEDAVSFWIPRAVFPVGAQLKSSTSATLFIANGTRADARIVLINSIEGDQVEIVSGLSANDSLILSPPPELKDQDPIEINAT